MRMCTNGVCISVFTGFMSDQIFGLCSRMASFLYFSREKIKKLSFNRVVTSGPWCQHLYPSEPCSLVKMLHSLLPVVFSIFRCIYVHRICVHVCPYTTHNLCKMLGLSKYTDRAQFNCFVNSTWRGDLTREFLATPGNEEKNLLVDEQIIHSHKINHESSSPMDPQWELVDPSVYTDLCPSVRLEASVESLSSHSLTSSHCSWTYDLWMWRYVCELPSPCGPSSQWWESHKITRCTSSVLLTKKQPGSWGQGFIWLILPGPICYWGNSGQKLQKFDTATIEDQYLPA